MAGTGRYLVMRYAELLGYSNGRKIVTVAGRRTTVQAALDLARGLSSTTRFWVAEVGRPAHRSQQRRGTRT